MGQLNTGWLARASARVQWGNPGFVGTGTRFLRHSRSHLTRPFLTLLMALVRCDPKCLKNRIKVPTCSCHPADIRHNKLGWGGETGTLNHAYTAGGGGGGKQWHTHRHTHKEKTPSLGQLLCHKTAKTWPGGEMGGGSSRERERERS